MIDRHKGEGGGRKKAKEKLCRREGEKERLHRRLLCSAWLLLEYRFSQMVWCEK